MPMQFDTSAYVEAHGRSPRGRGSWAFFFDTDNNAPIEQAWFTPGCLTYSEAKKLARAEAKRRGATFVTVGS
jgi:hypothetical protein